jgi:hypothetical protein
MQFGHTVGPGRIKNSGTNQTGQEEDDTRTAQQSAGWPKPMTSMTRAREANGCESLQIAAHNKVKTSD